MTKKRRLDTKLRGPGPKLRNQSRHQAPQRKPQSQSQSPSQPQPRKTQRHQQHQQQHQNQKPIIPFDPTDRILLIGEGDLSFAASLVTHHGCRNVVATVLEKSYEDLIAKYPHAVANIETINNPHPPPPPPPPPHTTNSKLDRKEGEEDEKDRDGEEEEEEEEEEEQDQLRRRVIEARRQQQNQNQKRASPKKNQKAPPPSSSVGSKVVYGIDATRTLPASVSRPRPTRIIFNFPHVGGKSTDVNRQVRHNQSLLVSFFDRAVVPNLAPGGTVVVTLFEAEPYTLWNVRDLARHSGLAVDRTFRFDWSAYPGYHHARTLGVVRSRHGPAGTGAGWKGEDRPCRTYIFARKGEEPLLPSQLSAAAAAAAAAAARKKRRRADSDVEEDSDMDNDSDDEY
ncbi:25S rRNA (uracil2634-N3)-methyltransferase [Geosmithia morbida]|uniref:25S rRNA (Uracil2634-N3)-methyltransferase n=1 Tax=Geosmithia morbida TaxID=1094350 RepID=A0A9P4YWQ7_9HYPO|nr:25S rRNA (uracil2634-N3)-methyltransferase [Geosmithia morbida]KAF4123174.1 25S rRNA (uracil2634-N3)-methyltransferase [Geosmithia morbida]